MVDRLAAGYQVQAQRAGSAVAPQPLSHRGHLSRREEGHHPLPLCRSRLSPLSHRLFRGHHRVLEEPETPAVVHRPRRQHRLYMVVARHRRAYVRQGGCGALRQVAAIRRVLPHQQAAFHQKRHLQRAVAVRRGGGEDRGRFHATAPQIAPLSLHRQRPHRKGGCADMRAALLPLEQPPRAGGEERVSLRLRTHRRTRHEQGGKGRACPHHGVAAQGDVDGHFHGRDLCGRAARDRKDAS